MTITPDQLAEIERLLESTKGQPEYWGSHQNADLNTTLRKHAPDLIKCARERDRYAKALKIIAENEYPEPGLQDVAADALEDTP